MSWSPLTVTWSKPAQKDLRRIEPKARRQIVDAVDHYAATGEGDITKMQDGSGYRLRIRSYRAIMTIAWSALDLTVIAVSTRGDAY